MIRARDELRTELEEQQDGGMLGEKTRTEKEKTWAMCPFRMIRVKRKQGEDTATWALA